MANKIEEFLNEKFGTVRAIKINDIFWFVAKDISDTLKYANVNKVSDKVDEEDLIKLPKNQLTNLGSWGQTGGRDVLLINEGGLYQVVSSITKKDIERYHFARDFKRWVMNEVLPTLRETGGYVENNREEEFVNNYFEGLSDETKKLMIKELAESNKKLQKKADKFDQFLDINSTHTFTEVAKMISTKATDNNYSFSISGQALTKHLRSKGILSKAKSGGDYTNAPIKRYENYFDVISRTIDESRSKPQTRVKPNGVDFLYDMFVEDGFSLFIK